MSLGAMAASSLATIVIHFPFRLMSGLAGSFFKELSDTMQLTMVASFLVTWLLLPVLHLVIGYKEKFRPKSLGVKELEEASIRKVRFLTAIYRKPAAAAALVLFLGLGGWLASSRLSSGFLPDLDEGTIVLDYHSPAGMSLVFTPDEEKLSRFGISLTGFQEQVAAYTGGIPLCQAEGMAEPDPSQAAMTGGLQIGSVQDGEQMQQPLAVAVIGGFIAGLPLLLIVLPALTAIFSKVGVKDIDSDLATAKP